MQPPKGAEQSIPHRRVSGSLSRMLLLITNPAALPSAFASTEGGTKPDCHSINLRQTDPQYKIHNRERGFLHISPLKECYKVNILYSQ